MAVTAARKKVMDLATYAMNKFKDIKFKQDTKYPHEDFDQSPKYNATYTAGELHLSVAYGGGCYGDGPKVDSYEIALFNGDDFVKLTEYDTVAGWMTAVEIDKIIDVMDNNPTYLTNRLELILQ